MAGRCTVLVSRDNTHDGPQWFAEAVKITDEGTEWEREDVVYATTWYATPEAAESDAKDWLRCTYWKKLP